MERRQPPRPDHDGATTVGFTYDGFGERIKKTTTSSTSLYPFGDDYEITNGTITKYISVEGLGVIAKREGSGPGAITTWLHADRLGSITSTTDGTRAVRSWRTYRPYGETLASGGTSDSRGWIDQRNDSETGLTYLHARYYDPQIGVFLSPDPIGVAGGTNAYGYGFGDPANLADRSGLDPDYVFCYPWPLCAGQGGGAGGVYASPGSPWPYGSPPPNSGDDLTDTLKSIGCFLVGAFCGPPGSGSTKYGGAPPPSGEGVNPPPWAHVPTPPWGSHGPPPDGWRPDGVPAGQPGGVATGPTPPTTPPPPVPPTGSGGTSGGGTGARTTSSSGSIEFRYHGWQWPPWGLEVTDPDLEETLNNPENWKLGVMPIAGGRVLTGFTRHGLNQVISRDAGRGVSAGAVLDALRNPLRIVQQGKGVLKYVGDKATVIINRAGKVITAYGIPRNP